MLVLATIHRHCGCVWRDLQPLLSLLLDHPSIIIVIVIIHKVEYISTPILLESFAISNGWDADREKRCVPWATCNIEWVSISTTQRAGLSPSWLHSTSMSNTY